MKLTCDLQRDEIVCPRVAESDTDRPERSEFTAPGLLSVRGALPLVERTGRKGVTALAVWEAPRK